MTEGGDGTFGKIVSEETKEKIRQKAIGREVTEATRIKLSEAGKIVTEAREAYWKSGQKRICFYYRSFKSFRM